MRNFQKFYISVLIILCLFLNNACSKAPEADSPFLSSFNQQEQQYYMVDIRGEVNRPGIYKVESGAMINDVIELAGGLTYQADISKIERGIGNPSVMTLKRLADGLEIELIIKFKDNE